MPTPLPALWPADDVVTTTPSVYIRFLDSSWPPASGDCPAGYAEVGGWSINRELVGNILPGNVRGTSGFSVGSASVTIGQADTGVLSPWAVGNARVTPGGYAKLYASHDGPLSTNVVKLGDWKVAPISGSLASNEIPISLVESSIGLRKPNMLPVHLSATSWVDASWIITQLAALAGFTSTDIQLLGVQLRSIFFEADKDAWTVIQETVAACLGAAWIASDGTLVVRGWQHLRGAAPTVETVEALGQVEDIKWSIDPADAADRVEVKFTPPDLIAADPVTGECQVAWSAEDAYEIGPGQTIVIPVNLPQAATGFKTFRPVWDGTDAEAVWSRWAAQPNRDGTGDMPPDWALLVGVTVKSGSRVELSIKNNTNVTLFTVDANGDPCLYLRASLVAANGAEVVKASGVAEVDALAPLELNFGTLMQRPEDADRVLSWIASSTAEPSWKLAGINVAHDWRRQIGDLIRLTHGPSALSVVALITAINLDGSAGSISQSLDLVVLDPLIYQFNEVWAGMTIGDFNAKWAGLTFADFNKNPLATV